jgi:hypothetical protein
MTRLLLLLLDVAWPEPPEDTDGSQPITRDGMEDYATDAALIALNAWWDDAYGVGDDTGGVSSYRERS